MTQDNKEKAGKKNSQMMKISFVSLLVVLLFMIEMYEIINDTANMVVIGSLGAFLLVSVYVEMLFISKLVQSRAQEQEEAFDHVYRSEKASYLLIRKNFDKMEQKMDSLGDLSNIPYKELIAAQKALAKAQINRNKQNTNALLISNDRMMQKLTGIHNDISDILTNTGSNAGENNNEIKAGLSEQDKAVFLEGNQNVLEKQQEILQNLKVLESSLRNEILESADKLASIKSQQMTVPKSQMQIEEAEDEILSLDIDDLTMPEPQMQLEETEEEILPLNMEDDFSLGSIEKPKKIVEKSSESTLDELLQQMNVSEILEPELPSISDDVELQPIAEESGQSENAVLESAIDVPELQPIIDESELQAVAAEPELQPIIDESELQAVTAEPELQPIIDESELQAVAAEPELQPIMDEPELQPVMPELEPIIDESELQAVAAEPELQPIINESELQSAAEPELQPIMSEPELQPVTDELELQSVNIEPELQPVTDESELQSVNIEPELQPVTDESELQPAVAEPELQPIINEPELQPVMSESELQPMIAEPEPQPAKTESELQSMINELELQSMVNEPELQSIINEPELQPVMPELPVQPMMDETDSQTVAAEPEIQPMDKTESGKAEESESLKRSSISETLSAGQEITPDQLAAMVANLGTDMKIEPEPETESKDAAKGSFIAQTFEPALEPVVQKESKQITEQKSADDDLEQIMKALDINDITESSLEDLDIDKILEIPVSNGKSEAGNGNQVMSSEEIAALIANTELLSEPETSKNDDMMDLSDPGHVMSSDEIAALIANM